MMRVLLDTGANQTFITSKALHDTNHKKFINKQHQQVLLADGNTRIHVLGEVQLKIKMGNKSTEIIALVVKDLCTDCILGMDYIDKYKLKIDVETQTISIRDNQYRFKVKIDSDANNIRFPARTINTVTIPPKQIMSVPVSLPISTAEMFFRPSLSIQQQIPITPLNSLLSVRQYSTSIPLFNPTSYPRVIPKGIIIGTTTVQSPFSQQKSSRENTSIAEQHINNLLQHVEDPNQRKKLEEILLQHSRLFDTSKLTIANTLKPHEIRTMDSPPPTSKPYYCNPMKQKEMNKIIEELLNSGQIRPSYSQYAAPALLTAKKDGTWRLVVDYKKLNSVTIKDNYPLPNMEQTLQTLGGGYKFFTKLDLKSGFWQIPIREKDRYKTAFITMDGLYEWNVLAQGLMNSPPSFQRVMFDVLSDCRQFALVYIDDIVIYSRTFDEHLQHLKQVLSALSQNEFQLNPPKCTVAHTKIDYLSHTISKHGITPNGEKIKAILNLPEPKTLAQANKFIGALSWYRKFIPDFATVAAPIHTVTNLTKANRHKFYWKLPQSQAFYELKKLLTSKPLFLEFPDDSQPVILTTDASKVGIGGTLQQEINGQIKNLYYHSQLTSPTQQRYDPIELEAFAIWACVRRMRSYIAGRKIIIYTDHCPLCNMMNKTVKNKRVDRIATLLQEYNIEKIIHIKGRHNCLQDYLSRHPIEHNDDELFDGDYGVCSNRKRQQPELARVAVKPSSMLSAMMTRSKTKQMTLQEQNKNSHSEQHATEDTIDRSSQSATENEFDITQLKIAQASDQSIQDKIREIQQNPTKHPYILKDDVLYKLLPMKKDSTRKKKLIYVPSSMVDSLLRVYHSDPLAGHFGIRRTYLKLKIKYWWPNMKQTIERYIQACMPCQQFNISRVKKPGQLHPIPPPEGPFQFIGIDYCGPLKRTPRENQYVLSITDYFTRWVTAIALPDCSAETTAQALFEDYICKYGVPKTILSDQGTHFNNHLMKAMARLIGYNHIYSTTYHPQSNGMVERFNATFVPQIAKLQDRENNNWDEFLSPVVFAYNTGTHATTNYSPFELQFGRQPRLPSDQPSSLHFVKSSDYYEQLKTSLGIMQQQARKNIIAQQQRYKNNYDKRRQDPQYQINDYVLIKSHGLKSKLEPKYSIVPKTIVKKQHPTYWVLDNDTQVETRVHVNDIRPVLLSETTEL